MPRPHLALLLAAALAGPSEAEAACVPPAVPDAAAKPAKPTPPVKGPCVDAKAGQAGCLGWEGAAFNEAVKAFNAQIPAYQSAANAYVARLNDYVKASGDYARCEVQSLQ